MTDSQTKLKGLLRELFQLDNADLDFGIYRIMNAKRVEIERFLDQDLLPQVKKAFEQYQSGDSAGIKAELEKTIQQAKEMGVADPEALPKVKELRAKLAGAVDVSALESQVFSDLYNFFRRYYSEGDFLSLRRYKEGVYAIPYEGEEVKLHWANHDQYYIKSSEYLRNYSFTVASGKRVHFALRRAEFDAENNKPEGGDDRRFILATHDPIHEAKGELYIWFEYKSDASKRRQDVLNAEAERAILSAKNTDKWLPLLAGRAPTAAEPQRTILAKHLADYSSRNCFDYFIHKDVSRFLRRELDFYIKNEVMHLDDIESARTPHVHEYLSRIRVLRNLSHKIIDFVSQIEDFQKKLFLKKKFVVETHYCVSLDRVSDALLPTIIANKQQLQEWVKLFAIQKIEASVLGQPGYSEPITEKFLRANPQLTIDTRFFDAKFTTALLAGINDLEAELTGVLVQGDNLQAMNLLAERYANTVECIFIDPPYNTGSDEFIYKDSYQHSSWMSMMFDRLVAARRLMAAEGVLWCSLDSSESARFWILAEDIFGKENFQGHIAWQHSVQTKGYAGSLAVGHNNIFAFSKSQDFELGVLERTDANNASYSNPDKDPKGDWRTGYLVNSLYRPNLKYEVTTPSGRKIAPPETGWRYSQETMQKKIATGEIFFSDDESRLIRKIYLCDQEGHVPNSVWLADESGTSRSGNLELKRMLPDSPISTVKPSELIERIATLSAGKSATVVDFFAGSGTTGHAVIKLNRADGGTRRFILVEMASYFDTVLKPRILKAAYSSEWKDGEPVQRDGTTQFIKCIKLESYEDTLNNIVLARTTAQQSLLDRNQEVREGYLLRYFLDVESTQGAASLSAEAFQRPFSVTLKVASAAEGSVEAKEIDLVETFNQLLGLRVKHCDTLKGIRVVNGINSENERVLVIWRTLKDCSNDDLDKFFQKQGYNARDMEYDVIYVNGDNNIENLRKDEHTWKVRLIEEEFTRRMFDTQEV